MKLSIITTIYKAEKDLPRLLDSMMAQKSPELEFFLINNGSPDNCSEIMAEYAKRDSRFKIHTIKENIGYIRARNEGLRLCDADYIGFCDSDDYLEPGGYDRAIAEIARYDCDFYLARWRINDANSATVLSSSIPCGFYSQTTKNTIAPLFFGDYQGKSINRGFVWKEIIKNSIIKDNNILFVERLKPIEDMLFNAQIAVHSASIYVSDNILYNYIVNSESITAQRCHNYNLSADIRMVTDFYELMSQACRDARCRASLSNYMLHGITTTISMASRFMPITTSAKILFDKLHKSTIRKVLSEAQPQGIDRVIHFLLLRRMFKTLLFLAKMRNKAANATVGMSL